MTAHPQAAPTAIAEGEAEGTSAVLSFDTLPGGAWETFECPGGPSTPPRL